MCSLTWLHLSDLHFRSGDAFDRNIVLKELLKDIDEQIRREQICPDFIVVTGDIAYSGRTDEYKLAQEFFDQLLKVTAIPKERLFVVPGNHDVERSTISAGARQIGETFKHQDEVNAVLGSADDMKLMMRRFKAFQTFLQEYGLICPADTDTPQIYWIREFKQNGRKIFLAGLNSAWVCGSDDDARNGVVIGERQVRNALQTDGIENESIPIIRIALMHHPFDRLREFDEDASAALLLDGFDFILHGHLHKTTLNQLTSPDSGCMRISGGACYQSRGFPNAYNFVSLDFDKGLGRIILRRFFNERGGYWDAGVGIYRNARYGVWTFQVPAKFYGPLQQIVLVGDDGRFSESTQHELSRRHLLESLLPDILNTQAVKKIRRDAQHLEIIFGPKYTVNISDSQHIVVGNQAKITSKDIPTAELTTLAVPDIPQEVKSLPSYNRTVIDEMCHNAFSDQELAVLSFDHFPAVYRQIGKMDKEQKINLLISYCFENNQVQELVALVQKYKPNWYSEYANRFWNDP